MYQEDITAELQNVPAGWTVTLHNEEGPENPYEAWDCASTFWADYADTNAGDRDTSEFSGVNLRYTDYYDREYQEWSERDVETWGDIRRYMEQESPGVIAYPVFLRYDGSYLVETGAFDGQEFDHNRTGVVYITREKALAEWGRGQRKHVTKRVRADATACMVAEIETYSQYATGDVWWYSIEDANGDNIDSCGGLYGSEYAREAAQEAVNEHLDLATPENTHDRECQECGHTYFAATLDITESECPECGYGEDDFDTPLSERYQ